MKSNSFNESEATHRRRAEASLRESEARFRTLAEMLPQLIWIAGPQGRLEYANERWCEYSGLSPKHVLRRAWDELVFPDDALRVHQAWKDAMRKQEPFEVEMRLRSASGLFQWFLTRGEPQKDDSGALVRWFGTCTDIHEQKRSLQEQRFFADLSDRMRMTLDPDMVLWEAVSAVGEHLKVSRCNFAEIDADHDTIAIRTDFCQGVPSHVGSYPLAAFGGTIDEMRRGRTVTCDDTAIDPRTSASFDTAYAPLMIQAFIAVPLIRKGQWVGVLSVHHAAPRHWEREEVELLGKVAERTWLAWENVALVQRSLEADARQLVFVRDVLASVTDGKLALCQSPAELPPPLTPVGSPIEISAAEGMAGIRNLARHAAEDLDYDSMRAYDLVTAVGEAAMNAVVHAGGGEGRIYTDNKDLIQVWITDHGAGIDVSALPQATLQFGYTTAGSLGHGMKMMLQTADITYLMTNPNGTTVVVEQHKVAPEPAVFK